MPEKIEECVKSVLDENPGMDESDAYAICNAMDNKGQLADNDKELQEFGEGDWVRWEFATGSSRGQVEQVNTEEPIEITVEGSDVRRVPEEDNPAYLITEWDDEQGELTNEVVKKESELTDADEPADFGRENAAFRLAAEDNIQNPDDIERVEEDGGAVRYTDIMLLAPGTWTDAASQQTIWYAPDAIKQSAANWSDDVVNLLHDQNDVSEVGRVDADSVYADDDGRMYGDLVLSGESGASQYAVELMDAALSDDEDSILGGPSVEITDDTTEWDDTRGLEKMVEMTFSGVGLVTEPASKPAAFDSQTRERAVALADADIDKDDIQLMTRELEVSREDFAEFVAENYDVSEEEALEMIDDGAASQMTEMVKDLLRGEAEEMEDSDDEDDDEEEMKDSEDDEDEEEDRIYGEDEVAELQDRIDELESRLADAEGDDGDEVAEKLSDIEDQVVDIEKRLSDLESEPQTKSLAAPDDVDDSDEEGAAPAGITTENGYIGR